MAKLEFDGLNLVVGDMDATIAFYRLLGVSIPDDTIWRTDSGAHHVDVSLSGSPEVSFDSSALATGYNAGFRADAAAARTLIGFRVDTREGVDETYERLTSAGVRGLQAPYDAFWGARYAIVEDPDGRQVGFMSPADPDRRGPPPEI